MPRFAAPAAPRCEGGGRRAGMLALLLLAALVPATGALCPAELTGAAAAAAGPPWPSLDYTSIDALPAVPDAARLVQLSATEAVAELCSRRLTSVAYSIALLKQARVYECVNAWASLSPRRVLAEAAAVDARAAAGEDVTPLCGLPVGLKDVLDAFGYPTTAATPALEGHYPQLESLLVARLKRANAVVLGKLRLHELGGRVRSWVNDKRSAFRACPLAFASHRAPHGAAACPATTRCLIDPLSRSLCCRPSQRGHDAESDLRAKPEPARADLRGGRLVRRQRRGASRVRGASDAVRRQRRLVPLPRRRNRHRRPSPVHRLLRPGPGRGGHGRVPGHGGRQCVVRGGAGADGTGRLEDCFDSAILSLLLAVTREIADSVCFAQWRAASRT